MDKVKEFVKGVAEELDSTGGQVFADRYRSALFRNPELADLILYNITVEEVVAFVEEVRTPGVTIGVQECVALLSNPCLHKLIAVNQLAEDEDEFCRTWKYDERLGAWKKKKVD